MHFSQSQPEAERAYSVYPQAGPFSSRIGIILRNCMLVTDRPLRRHSCESVLSTYEYTRGDKITGRERPHILIHDIYLACYLRRMPSRINSSPFSLLSARYFHIRSDVVNMLESCGCHPSFHYIDQRVHTLYKDHR